MLVMTILLLFHDQKDYLTFIPLFLRSLPQAANTMLFHTQELYDQWAFDIAWLIYERKLIKRLAFACNDAMKVARKVRRKAYLVYVMTTPDTCEAWFGR